MKRADPSFQKNTPETYCLGLFPFDKEDEGFNSIGVDLAIEEMHESQILALGCERIRIEIGNVYNKKHANLNPAAILRITGSGIVYARSPQST